MRIIARISSALGAWVIALGLVAGNSAPASSESVLRVVLHADLKILDPVWTTHGISQNHALMIYDFLFAWDENSVPQPQMVDTYEVTDDGKHYRFTLRDGLQFHDGAPVTTADVIASLKRWGARDSSGQQVMSVTESLSAVDDKTFEWKLSKPYGLLLEALGKTTSRVAAIMPESVAMTDPETQIESTIGSGPFIFQREEWVPGSKVVYVRNPNYVPRSDPASSAAGGKIAKVDRVEWLNIRDPQTAVSALINGEIDFYENPPADFLPSLKDKPITLMATNPIGYQGVLRPNHLHPPFDNRLMRQGLMWAVNQDTYLRTMFGDPLLYRTCGSYFACGTLLESEAGAEALLAHDPEMARQAFEEAGYNGEPIVILHPTDVPIMNAATLVTAQLLREAGLNVQLEAMDWSTMGSRRAVKEPVSEGGWNILHTYWNGPGISNPLTNKPVHATCEQAWPGWPCDEDHQSLIDDYPFAQTIAEKRALAQQIQESAVDFVPYVPLGQWQQPAAFRNELDGVLIVPGGVVFWNIEKPS